MLLPLSLLGSFKLPLLVVPPVLLPFQPLVLVLLVAVIPAGEKTRDALHRECGVNDLPNRRQRQGCKRRSKDVLIRCLSAMIRGRVRRSHRSAGERRRWGAGQLRLSAQIHMSLLSAYFGLYQEGKCNYLPCTPDERKACPLSFGLTSDSEACRVSLGLWMSLSPCTMSVLPCI